MRLLLPALLIGLFSCSAQAQNIPWSADTELTLSDFRSPQTEINPELESIAISCPAMLNFFFSMSNYEFMFTKNFNNKVSVEFMSDAAIINSPDTLQALYLVNYANYVFDLNELYARRLRKKLYEEKSAFSSFDFFRQYYDQYHRELVAEHNRVLKVSDYGRNVEVLEEEHQKVNQELMLMADYCKSCKLSKRKKNKN